MILSRWFAVCAFLATGFLLTVSNVVQAHPSYGGNCSDCHGDNTMATTPANGGTLLFGAGANGYTLVGHTSSANLTISDTTTSQPEGGFNGNFPAGGGSFALTGSAAIVGRNGYLTPGTSESRTYTFSPTVRGVETRSVSFTPITGFSGTPPTSTITFKGQGVAPVISLDTTLVNAGNVRIGTAGTAKLTVKNVGDGNLSGLGAVSNLTGSLPALTGAFTASTASINLADNGTQAFQATFTPTSHGAAQNSFNVSATDGSTDGKNLAQTLPVTFAGTGVGPIFGSSVTPGSTIDFGTVTGATGQKSLSLSNATTDPSLGSLTDLTLLSASITGADAGMFSLGSFTPNTVLSKSGSLNLNVNFTNPGSAGTHSAMLTFVTDENAALGAAGHTFSYQLSAVTAVPEPSVAILISLAVVGLIVWRRWNRPA